jgi:hypothetical protein
MLENDINFDFNFNDKNTELVNLKNPINDSESEINTSFDNSELKNTIIKGIEKYFSCSKCSKIVSNTESAKNVINFIVGIAVIH